MGPRTSEPQKVRKEGEEMTKELVKDLAMPEEKVRRICRVCTVLGRMVEPLKRKHLLSRDEICQALVAYFRQVDPKTSETSVGKTLDLVLFDAIEDGLVFQAETGEYGVTFTGRVIGEAYRKLQEEKPNGSNQKKSPRH